MWTRLSLTYVDKLSAKMQTKDGTFPKILELVDLPDGEEEGTTADNDIARNVLFFRHDTPMTNDWWRLRLLDQAVPFP